MECQTYDRLESGLIRLREQRTLLAMSGEPADEVFRQLVAAERQAAICLTDHGAEHKCKKSGE
jgi:hypothetical protein